MEKTGKLNVICGYIYLAIPVAIFICAWFRWYIALPTILLFAYGMYMLIKEAPSVWQPQKNTKTRNNAILFLVIIGLIVYLSGMGEFAYQNSDHKWRNSIFNILCDSSWPVYDVSAKGNKVSLVYYIGYWLPSAIIGKLFGKGVGYAFLLFWGVLGIAIFYSLVCSKLKKFKLWPLLLFFAFSGLDIAQFYFFGKDIFSISSTQHIEWASSTFQYSSFITQLFWVFNQAIPAWILTVLLLLEKNNRNIVFLISLALLSSTMTFFGIVPIAACIVFSRKYENADTAKKWWKSWFKDTFTFQNVFCGGAVGILTFLYLVSSPRSEGDKGTSLFSFVGNDYEYFFTFLMRYLIFITFEVLIYLIAVYPYFKNKKLYYVIAISLFVIPIVRMGDSYDFCMRASIPALVILYLYVARTLEFSYKEKRFAIFIPLIIALLIGFKTPMNEIVRSTANTSNGYITDGSFDLMKDEKQVNFVAPTEDNFFFEYIAKK